jgi:hypothetical protein
VLLRSDNVALVLSFLGRVFVDGNASGIPASELADQLDDELFALKQRLGEDAFPRSATAYLDDWASPEHGWLRKYYPAGADEAHFDFAPAVEKALLWVQDLPAREFIGTESHDPPRAGASPAFPVGKGVGAPVGLTRAFPLSTGTRLLVPINIRSRGDLPEMLFSTRGATNSERI